MSVSIPLTWNGDTTLRAKIAGINRVFVPGKSITFTADDATSSKRLMAFAKLGLFREIDPAHVPDTLGSTPLATAIAATSPHPFTTTVVRPPYDKH
jgi:hypothetical protein